VAIVNAGQQQDNPPTKPVSETDKAESPTQPEKPAVAEDLLNGAFSNVWTHYSSQQDSSLEQVWKLKKGTTAADTELVCVGDPKGFLFTKQQFSDFELTFDWKYPTDPNGNSGILIYTQNDRRLWPTSVQIQLHHPKAGSIFPSGDAKSSNTSDVTDVAGQFDKWNNCRIVSESGRVSVSINGKKVGEVSGCMPATGSIAIQSEGSEVHFRRMRVLPLPRPAKTVPPTESVEKPDDGTKPTTATTDSVTPAE
jgi:hypothetical protein